MPWRRLTATCASFCLRISSTSCDTARLRARSPADSRASSYSPPAYADGETNIERSKTLFIILVFIRPTLGLRRPIFLVVADEPFDVQLAEHLRRESSRRQIFDLPLDLALLPDYGVDLAEPRLAQHAVEPPPPIYHPLAHQ